MATVQFRTGIDQGLHPRGTPGDREDAEAMEPESGAVDGLGPGRRIGQEFALEGGLGKGSPPHRHGSPVGFQKEAGALQGVRWIEMLQGKHPVGDDAELLAVGESDLPAERWSFAGEPKFVIVNEADAGLPARKLDGHHHVGNQEGMFKEEPANGTVLLAPRYGAKRIAKFLFQERSSLVP